MSDGMDPDAIRARSFSTGRRGFERAEVEAFQAEVAAEVTSLTARLTSLEDQLSQLGITELPDLKAEIDTVGSDIAEIMQAARTAAEEMRERAAADAASTAASAAREAEQARKDAWETSDAMLRGVTAAAEEMSSKASEDALFVRAEAEREALRLASDAKRESEELLRAAREESDGLTAEAKAAAESTRANANQTAELAQERVRALEERRAELIEELEEARVELAALEDKIEGRTAELTHATTDPSESSVRILTSDDESEKPDIGEWLDEDATVRLVPPPPEMPLDPVDADELVAEVESLRSVRTTAADADLELVSGGSKSSAESASLDFEVIAGEEPSVADKSPTTALQVAVPESPPLVEDSNDVAAAEEQATAPEPVAAERNGGKGGDIDDLFASLRRPDAEQKPSEPGEPEDEADSSPVATEAETAGTAIDGDAWELRDRSLVPMTNDVLRAIKRQIVDVQNAVLEELRTQPDEWRPKKAMFDDILGAEAGAIASQAYVAGVAASGELAATPAPALADQSTHTLTSLVTDLWAAVVDAIDGTTGGNSRERGASVGRIFRAWRTDEVERRVRQVAHAEYNAGVAAGLDSLGLEHEVDPSGRDIADPDATVIVSR